MALSFLLLSLPLPSHASPACIVSYTQLEQLLDTMTRQNSRQNGRRPITTVRGLFTAGVAGAGFSAGANGMTATTSSPSGNNGVSGMNKSV